MLFFLILGFRKFSLLLVLLFLFRAEDKENVENWAKQFIIFFEEVILSFACNTIILFLIVMQGFILQLLRFLELFLTYVFWTFSKKIFIYLKTFKNIAYTRMLCKDYLPSLLSFWVTIFCAFHLLVTLLLKLNEKIK